MADPAAAWERPQAPAATPCAVDGCPHTVAPTWIENGARGFWVHGGQRCVGHEQAAQRDQHSRAMVERLTRANVPRGKWNFTFDRFLKMEAAEDFAAFRARLAAFDLPHLGITRWNARLAANLRAWRPEDRTSRYVTGPVGGGKTILAAAKVRQLLERDFAGGCYYITEAELYESQRERAAAPRGHQTENKVARARDAGLLVLDDVGTTEEVRAWQRDVFEQIICSRYDGDRPILLTSNLALPELADVYGERVGSRLTEMCGRSQEALVGMDWRSMNEHQRAEPAKKPVRVPAGTPEPQGDKPQAAKAPPRFRDAASAAANDRDQEE